MTDQEAQYLIERVRRRLDRVNSQVVIGRNSPGVGPFEEITYANLASYLTLSGGLGTGTVTSVGLTAPSLFVVTGSPVTSSGTIAVSFNAQTANTFLAGPTTGASATPTMRALVIADMPAGVWTSSNDGAASGLDADLLDGQQGTYYLARANHTGTQAWGTLTGTPTTLAGYGITDAASDAELAAHAAVTSGVHGITAFGASLVDDASATVARTTLGLGTSATLNVPAVGDAASGEVVRGSDTRLTNARTPTAHTHPSTDISDSTSAGRALLIASTAGAQRTALGLGTSATLDVPAAGNAATGQVVKGDDTRLSDARFPSYHTHAISDTFGLETALDGKLDLTGGTVSGGLNLTGIGSDVSAVASYRFLVRDPGTNAVRPMTASFARGFIDAAASFHTHTLSDISDAASFGRTLVQQTTGSAARSYLGCGTAATYDAPSTGDATSGQLVRGSDSRLTDSRFPTYHTHPASDITSGVMDAARLGTGTANSSTFLRGDGTWNVPPSGGGGAWAITHKSSGYTATDSDNIIVCNFGADGQITLPTSGISSGRPFTVIRTGGAGVVTVKDGGGNTLRAMNTAGASSTWIWSATDSAYYLISFISGS